MTKKILVYRNSTPTPARATEQAWGIDLFVSESVRIPSHSVTIIKMGAKTNFKSILAARSSIYKKGVLVANGIGVIDADFRGEVSIALYNTKDYGVNIEKGERIAQLLVEDDVEILGLETEEFDERDGGEPTKRGKGGFGSTGEKEIKTDETTADKNEKDETETKESDVHPENDAQVNADAETQETTDAETQETTDAETQETTDAETQETTDAETQENADAQENVDADAPVNADAEA